MEQNIKMAECNKRFYIEILEKEKGEIIEKGKGGKAGTNSDDGVGKWSTAHGPNLALCLFL